MCCQNPAMERGTSASGGERVAGAVRGAAGRRREDSAPDFRSLSERGRADAEASRRIGGGADSIAAAIEFREAFRRTHDLGGESLVALIREGRRCADLSRVPADRPAPARNAI